MVQQLKLRRPQQLRQHPNQKQQRLPSPRHPQLQRLPLQRPRHLLPQLLLQHPRRHLHLLLRPLRLLRQ